MDSGNRVGTSSFDICYEDLALLGGPPAPMLGGHATLVSLFWPLGLARPVREVHPRSRACFIRCMPEFLISPLLTFLLAALNPTARDESEQCTLTRRRFAMLCDLRQFRSPKPTPFGKARLGWENYQRTLRPHLEPSFRKYWFTFKSRTNLQARPPLSFHVVGPNATGQASFAMLKFLL